MSIFTTAAAATAALLITAYGAGQFTQKSIQTEITIDAPAEAVWQALTQSEDISSWNPFVKKLDGTIAVGETLAVTIQQPNGSAMDFAPTVLVADENRELRWVGRLGFKGIFDGEHYYVLEQQADGTTLFRHGETFRGMLVHVLYPLIGDSTTEGFKQMNAALKAEAEA